MNDCLFCKIVRKDIPSTSLYEDQDVYAFLDIQPVQPGHVLVVPKIHAATLLEMQEESLTKTILAVQRLTKAVVVGLGVSGFNVVQNNGAESGQKIFHVHFHIIPRRAGDGLEVWPNRAYSSEQEKAEIAERICQSL
jgi:histidine triad (HIT) family protein